MKTVLKPLQEEQGSILILCVLMLFLLTVLGISSTTTSDLEMSIATNENFFHMAFYQADGGAEAGKEIVEYAIETRIWVDTTTPPVMINFVEVWDVDFYKNGALSDTEIPSDANKDVAIPVTVEGRNLTTFLRYGGATDLAVGSAIQMAAGYDGIGKGAAGGGAWIDYDIRSNHEGIRNSRSKVQAGWRHVI
jgi:hypothetical protein